MKEDGNNSREKGRGRCCMLTEELLKVILKKIILKFELV